MKGGRRYIRAAYSQSSAAAECLKGQAGVPNCDWVGIPTKCLLSALENTI